MLLRMRRQPVEQHKCKTHYSVIMMLTKNLQGNVMLKISAYIALLSILVLSAFPSTYLASDRQNEIAGYKLLKTYSKVVGNNSNLPFLFPPDTSFEDSSGHFWFSSLRNVFRYREKDSQWDVFQNVISPSSGFISYICQSRDGKIWARSALGKGSEGIVYFCGDKWRPGSEILPFKIDGTVNAMFTGKDGRLWIFIKEGLLVYDGQQWSAEIAMPESIGRAYAQLQARRPHFESPNRSKPLSNASNVFCGLVDQDGYIWLGTRHTILRVDEKKREWTYYSLPQNLGQVRYIYEDSQARLWVSDDWGCVAVFDKHTFEWRVYKLLEPTLNTLTPEAFFPVYSMYQGKKRYMIFTTIIGLMILDETLNEWKICDSRNSALPTDFVTTIMADRHDRIWLGTGQGILLLGQ